HSPPLRSLPTRRSSDLLFIIMFWSSRSQAKKQAAALAALKKGDRVLTQSGLVGKLVDVGDRYAKLDVGGGVKIEILKTALAGKEDRKSTRLNSSHVKIS